MAIVTGLTSVGTSVDEATYAAVISDMLIKELRPMTAMRPFLRHAPSTNGRSASYDFLAIDPDTSSGALISNVETWAEDRTGGTASASFLGDTDFDAERFDVRDLIIDNIRVTAGVYGIAAATDDFAEATTLIDIMGELKGLLARTLAEHWESTVCSVFSDFTTAQTAASTLTSGDILAAIATLEQRNVSGGLVFVGHSKQAHEIREDLQAKVSSYWERESASDSASLHEYHRESYVGSLFGVPIHQTNSVDSASSRWVGLLFTPQEAIGYISLWDAKTETDRVIQTLTDEVVCSTSFGVTALTNSNGMGAVANERAVKVTSLQ